MTWNECKERVNQLGDPIALLLVRVLDGWMEDYVHDEDWWIGLDERESMGADIVHYRSQLMMLIGGEDGRRRG